jgi:valyl-tRNA synthetase
MKIGRRLAIKVLNVSRFVLGAGPVGSDGSGPAGSGGRVTAAVDQALTAALDQLITEATTAFEGYDYARALERTEAFFWSFCDNYVELVKNRSYGEAGDPGAVSARVTLRHALSVLLRLFAPVLPYVTEEVWSWFHDDGSIHRAAWPATGELTVAGGRPEVLAAAYELLGEVRRHKTERGVSLRAPVALVRVAASPEHLERLHEAVDDLRQAGSIGQVDLIAAGEGSEPAVEVVLAEA